MQAARPLVFASKGMELKIYFRSIARQGGSVFRASINIWL